MRRVQSPALSIYKVILSLSSLLNEPNFADPLNGQAVDMYKRNKGTYEQYVREQVTEHALRNEAFFQAKKAAAAKSRKNVTATKSKNGDGDEPDDGAHGEHIMQSTPAVHQETAENASARMPHPDTAPFQGYCCCS